MPARIFLPKLTNLTQRLLGAREDDDTGYTLLGGVSGSVDLVDALWVTKLFYNGAADISAAALTMLSVATGKRVRILSISKGATAGTPNIYVSDPTGNSSQLVLGTTGAAVTRFDQGLTLTEKFNVVLDQGAAGDTAIVISMLYQEQDHAIA